MWNTPFVVVMYNKCMANVFGLDTADFSQNSNYQGIITPYFGKILNVFFFIAGAAAIIYVVWSGIKMIQSKGDPKLFGEARSHLINAVIGIALVGSAYLILSIGIGLGNDASSLRNNAVTLPVGNSSSSSGGNSSCTCGYILVTDSEGHQYCELDPSDPACP